MTTLNAHVNNILNDGFSIIRNALKKNECKKLKKIGKKIYKQYEKKIKIKNPLEQTIYNLHNKNKIFIKYIKFEKTFKIIEKVLSSGAYQNKSEIIIRQIAMRNPLKGHAQQLHNDTRIAGGSFPLAIHAIYMLDDFSKRNGATRVVPRSQKRIDFARTGKKYKSEKILTGKIGDVIIFDASVWHGSAKKINDEERWGMIFSYSRWFLKPDFDYTQNTNKKIFNKLSKEQKKILGFNYNPPVDEFTRSSAILRSPQKPTNYKLPS